MWRLNQSSSEVRGVGLALAIVALVTIVIVGLIQVTGLSHGSIIYLIPVIVAAVRWGIAPALAAAFAGAGASAFFFYPPIYSFHIDDPQEVLDLTLFIIVAVVTGQLATRIKHQADLAQRREHDMRDLYAFSRRLATAFAASEIHVAIQEHLSALIQRRVILLGTAAAGNEIQPSSDDVIPASVRAAATRIAEGDHEPPGGIVIDDGRDGAWLVRKVSKKMGEFGVVAIDLGENSEDSVEDLRQRVDAVLADAAATLERLGIAGAINEARLRAETEVLREALIGSVSHELRTPLASILGAATVLHDAPAVAGNHRLRDLARVVRDEAERLNNDIQNFLDATRISSASIKPRLEWADPADIANSALNRCQRRLGSHHVAFDIADDLPMVFSDSVLIEQALVQVLDNAAKYSPPGSTVHVSIGAEPDTVSLSVRDAGVGLTDEEKTHLWERFFRGERHSTTVTGSGLGLWIASAFVAANGGKLDAISDGAGRGTTITIALPVARDAMLQKVSATGDADG